jgi:hypothetical protein
MTNSIFRLPEELICSSPNFKPATQLVPKKLHGPVNSVTNPIFTGGLSCAALMLAAANSAALAVAVTASVFQYEFI